VAIEVGLYAHSQASDESHYLTDFIARQADLVRS
jgi:hypothetical protein